MPQRSLKTCNWDCVCILASFPNLASVRHQWWRVANCPDHHHACPIPKLANNREAVSHVRNFTAHACPRHVVLGDQIKILSCIPVAGRMFTILRFILCDLQWVCGRPSRGAFVDVIVWHSCRIRRAFDNIQFWVFFSFSNYCFVACNETVPSNRSKATNIIWTNELHPFSLYQQ